MTAALLNAMLDEQKVIRAQTMGGVENKNTKMRSMTNTDKPAASNDNPPAHVHP